MAEENTRDILALQVALAALHVFRALIFTDERCELHLWRGWTLRINLTTRCI